MGFNAGGSWPLDRLICLAFYSRSQTLNYQCQPLYEYFGMSFLARLANLKAFRITFVIEVAVQPIAKAKMSIKSLHWGVKKTHGVAVDCHFIGQYSTDRVIYRLS